MYPGSMTKLSDTPLGLGLNPLDDRPIEVVEAEVEVDAGVDEPVVDDEEVELDHNEHDAATSD